MADTPAGTSAQPPVQTPEPTPDAEIAKFEQETNDMTAPEPKPKPKPTAEKPEPAAEPKPDAEKPEPKPDTEDAPPRKKSFQERIDELTNARRSAEREAQDERTKREDLERRLAALETASRPADKPAEPPKGGDQPPVPDGPKKPSPDDYDFGEFDARYIEALANYHVDTKLAARERAAEESRKQEQETQTKQQQEAAEKQRAFRQAFEESVAETATKYDDFQEKVFGGAERGEYALSVDLANIIAESPVGGDIVYHLATNPEESGKVHAMTPLEQARWAGRMEARFSAEQGAAPVKGNSVPAKAPKAPEPVPQAKGAGGQFEAGPDTSDFRAFEARYSKVLNG